MGADIQGAGHSNITINGVSELRGITHTVIPDRIVAATYLAAAAAAGGDVTLENFIPSHLTPVISLLSECGCKITTGENTI